VKTCEHYQPDGHGGVRCQKFRYQCSMQSCAGCPSNTAAGCWPTHVTVNGKRTPRPKREKPEIELLVERHCDDPLLGDRIEEWARRVGADRAAAEWEAWTGVPCGCGWRKRVINRLHETWRAVRARVSAT
jgi:hypothetical protein